MSNLYKGVIDMHIHGTPSVAKRHETEDMMRDMGKLGYKAFVLKDHYYPSAGVCRILNHWLKEETGVTACSSIILNNAVGGINLFAVDCAVNMGVNVVSFPTISAKCHLKAMSNMAFAGSGKDMIVNENDHPITVLDDNGELKPEVVTLIEYMSRHPEICLWTGHLDVPEIDKIVDECVKKGVKKLYANHPYWMINASLEKIREWCDKGVYIELNMGVLSPWGGGEAFATDRSVVLEIIKTFPIRQLVLVTDHGQFFNPMPGAAMTTFLEYLMENGVTEEQINIMAKEVPAYLLNLND